MKVFCLNRVEDETGISGTGVVARGVIFPSGKCALEWMTKHKSVALYDSLAEVEAIHGHGGKTKVVVEDPLNAINATAGDLFKNDCENIDFKGWRQESLRLQERLAGLLGRLGYILSAGSPGPIEPVRK
jgi:hypothetical protein